MWRCERFLGHSTSSLDQRYGRAWARFYSGTFADCSESLHSRMAGEAVRPEGGQALFGSSPEAISSISGERPVFGWCEALDVPWLSRASILRFTQLSKSIMPKL